MKIQELNIIEYKCVLKCDTLTFELVCAVCNSINVNRCLNYNLFNI